MLQCSSHSAGQIFLLLLSLQRSEPVIMTSLEDEFVTQSILSFLGVQWNFGPSVYSFSNCDIDSNTMSDVSPPAKFALGLCQIDKCPQYEQIASLSLVIWSIFTLMILTLLIILYHANILNSIGDQLSNFQHFVQKCIKIIYVSFAALRNQFSVLTHRYSVRPFQIFEKISSWLVMWILSRIAWCAGIDHPFLWPQKLIVRCLANLWIVLSDKRAINLMKERLTVKEWKSIERKLKCYSDFLSGNRNHVAHYDQNFYRINLKFDQYVALVFQLNPDLLYVFSVCMILAATIFSDPNHIFWTMEQGRYRIIHDLFHDYYESSFPSIALSMRFTHTVFLKWFVINRRNFLYQLSAALEINFIDMVDCANDLISHAQSSENLSLPSRVVTVTSGNLNSNQLLPAEKKIKFIIAISSLLESRSDFVNRFNHTRIQVCGQESPSHILMQLYGDRIFRCDPSDIVRLYRNTYFHWIENPSILVFRSFEEFYQHLLTNTPGLYEHCVEFASTVLDPDDIFWSIIFDE